MSRNRSSFLSLLILALVATQYVQGAVLGVDFGSEFLKISTISPGKSFSIVEDTTTKRKTPAAIGFYNGERIWEWDIYSKRPRAFQTTFMNLPKYLGKLHNDTQLLASMKLNLEDYLIKETDKGSIAFSLKNFKLGKDDDRQYELKIEEIVAMIMRHVKELADKQSQRVIKDVVVTIPPWWGFQERYALHDALVIAGLNPLAFVHENTAAALYYALERQDNQTHTAMFYNLGSGSLKVSIIEFELVNSTEKGDKNRYESLRVISEAWDETVGGLTFDVNLAKYLAKQFDELPQRKGKKSILSSNPAIAKLIKESNKLKETLSANKIVQFYAESIFESTDLKLNMERSKFEELNAEVFAKLTKPIDEALRKAGKTINDIDAFEILGGAVRIPKVQQILAEYLQGKEVGAHLNGDESMALGSAFYAANLSSSFKTRPIYLSDGYNFDIRVELKNLNPIEGEENAFAKAAILFPAKTRYGTKKALAFNHDRDIQCTIYAVKPEGDELVVTFNITGIDDIKDNPKYKDLGVPKINLGFRLSPLGFIELNRAEASLEETVLIEDKTATKKNTTKEAKTETKPENKTETNTEETAEKKPEESEGKTDESKPENATETTNTTSAEPEKKYKKKVVTHTVTLRVSPFIPAPGSFNQDEIEISKELLDRFDKYEAEKRRLAEAKNRLESFIYRSRELVEDNTFIECSKEEERENLTKLGNEYAEWLESDEAYTAKVKDFDSRYKQMTEIADKVQHRIEQREKRDSVVEKAKSTIQELKNKVEELNTTKPWIPEKDINATTKLIDDFEKWLNEVLEKQAALPPNEDPAFTVEKVASKLKSIKESYDRVRNIPKPKPPKTKNGTNATNGTEGTGFNFDGKFDEEAFKEYLKKMGNKFGEEGAQGKQGESQGQQQEESKGDQAQQSTQEEKGEKEKTDDSKAGEDSKRPDPDL